MVGCGEQQHKQGSVYRRLFPTTVQARTCTGWLLFLEPRCASRSQALLFGRGIVFALSNYI
jgi:hypothetical protein